MAQATQDPSMLEILAENMRRRRKALGLTQAQVAERMGAHQPYVSLLEAGGCNLSLHQLEWLAEALECTPAALLRS